MAYPCRQPEATLLYKTLQAHWLGFRATIESDGGELAAFVRDERGAYLRGGILVHGFLRVWCKDCGHSRVVSFSCKRRGFCPSWLGRRMADRAAFCVDHLFPRIPVRQFVLTAPVRLRFRAHRWRSTFTSMPWPWTACGPDQPTVAWSSTRC